MRASKLVLLLGLLVLAGLWGALRSRTTSLPEVGQAAERVLSLLAGGREWILPPCSGRYTEDRQLWLSVDLTGGCGLSGPWRPYRERQGALTRVGFGLEVFQGQRFLGRYFAEGAFWVYPRHPGQYAWAYVEGPPDPGPEGPVYAASPLEPHPGRLTLTASCREPTPKECRRQESLAGRQLLYEPLGPYFLLGKPGEARVLARKVGLDLGPFAAVRLEPAGRDTFLWVETPKGTRRLRLSPGRVVWADALVVRGGRAGSGGLTLAGGWVEALAPLGGEAVGLLSEGPLFLKGRGEVRAALLSRRDAVRVEGEVRVVGSVAAYRHTSLPLTFRPSEPPGFPLLPEVRDFLLLSLRPL